MSVRVTDSYHQLRVAELELTADYLHRVAVDRERARELRAQQREEEQARREMQRERDRLEHERAQYLAVLERLDANGGDPAARANAEEKLVELAAAIEEIGRREANIRTGWVYVISNLGSFGPGVVKIGMTRRLEPMDRVRELGDASVPFRFDTHALIHSEDAVSLETALHQALAHRKVNLVNERREFFYATPAEVRDLLAGFDSAFLLEFREDPEAEEWRQSENTRAGGAAGPGGAAAPSSALTNPSG